MRKFDKMCPDAGGTWQGILNTRRMDEVRRRSLERSQNLWRRDFFSVADRFVALATAAHYHYRLRVIGKLMRPAERAEHFRFAYLYLNAARHCDKPRIP